MPETPYGTVLLPGRDADGVPEAEQEAGNIVDNRVKLKAGELKQKDYEKALAESTQRRYATPS